MKELILKNIKRCGSWVLLLLVTLVITRPSYASKPPNTPKTLYFTENKGQWDSKYLYKAAIGQGTMFIEKGAFQYLFYNQAEYKELTKHPNEFWKSVKGTTVHGHALRVAFIGANEDGINKPENPLGFYSNYFLGEDSSHWASGVKSFQGFTIKNLLNGIDLKVTASNNSPIKYDLYLKPHADASQIKLRYEGADALQIKSDYLYIKTSLNTLVEKAPYAYQKIEGAIISVPCKYKISEDNIVGFELGNYNHEYELIIDPELIFSTYSGSTSNNFGSSATYDSDGNLYTAGITLSDVIGYPTTQGAFAVVPSGGTNATWPQNGFKCDITISKYNNDGTSLLFATYLGGTQNDYPHSLVVDKFDQLIVMGSSLSKDYPVTTSAFDKTQNDSFDIILTKFNKTGSILVGSTYVGGSHADGLSIADTLCMGYMDHMRGEVIVDQNNDVIVGTTTNSFNFPVTSSAFQQTKKGAQDGCVFKMDSALTTIKWATFLGDTFNESLNSVDVDANGNVFAVGGTHSKHMPIKGPVVDSTYHGGYADAYIAKISKDGNTLMRFKYWGSINYDQSYFVKVHNNGDVYMMGQNFDTTPSTPNVYLKTKGSINISCFTKDLDTLKYATRIGNTANKNILVPSAFMVDLCGNVYGSVWGGSINYSNSYRTGGYYVSATSTTVALQTTPDALQSTTDNRDFYLFELSPTLNTLLYATYMGEFGQEDHVDGGTSRFDHRGIIYQSFCASCGSGPSGAFPTTPNSYSPTNLSPQCSNASMKLDFRKTNIVIADFTINKRQSCTDSVVTFINNSYNGVRFRWYINGVLRDSTYNYKDTFRTKGINTVKLVVIDSLRCNIIDSLTKTVEVQSSSNAKFIILRDTCSPNVFFKNLSTAANNDVVPFLWDFGDGDTSTKYNPTHLFKKNGQYTVTLTSNYNSFCLDTQQMVIDYDSTAQFLKASIFPFDTLGCEPQGIHITNTSKNGRQYYWYINGVLASKLKNFDSTMKKGDYDFKLIIEDSSTCAKRDSAFTHIKIYPDVIPDFSYKRDSCSFTVSFTNLSNILPGDSPNFVWVFGDGDTSIVRNPVHVFPSPGNYRVQLFNNPRLLCVREKFIQLQLDNNSNQLDAKFNIKPPFGCRPATLLFENKSLNGSKYLWHINSVLKDSTFNFTHLFDSTGIYKIRLIAIDSGSCFKSDTLDQDVTISTYAKALFTVVRDTCSPNIIITNLTDSTQHDPITYLWDFGDGTTETTRTVSHVYSQNGDYQIKLITNPFTPCADSLVIPLKYDSLSHLLKADFTLNDTILCLPVYLQAINNSIGAKHSSWYINNTFKDTTYDLNDTIPNQGAYQITLIVKNDKSCKLIDTLTKPFSVLPAALTSFNISRDSCSLDVIFNNTSSTGQLPQVWLWNFGDGDTSTVKNPSHTYLKSDIYTIKLISNPGTYCSDTATMDWRIDGDSLQPLRVPNVFTPNGDNLNDCLTVKGVSRDCDKYHIWIRNRWGDLYFESTHPQDCWNGKNSFGEEAPEGVYFYILRIKKLRGESIDEAGTITLIRN